MEMDVDSMRNSLKIVFQFIESNQQKAQKHWSQTLNIYDFMYPEFDQIAESDAVYVSNTGSINMKFETFFKELQKMKTQYQVTELITKLKTEVMNELDKEDIRRSSPKFSKIQSITNSVIREDNFQADSRNQKIEQKRQEQIKPSLANNKIRLESIQASDLTIVVKFLSPRVDLAYKSGDKTLRQELRKYIYNEISKETFQIKVINSKSILPILQESVLHQKSQAAGNYMFDPFFGCFQFFIRMKNNQQFTRTFKIDECSQKYPQIIEEPVIDEKEWEKISDLYPTDEIEKLIGMFCDKKQENIITKSQTIRKFYHDHGVRLIRDLFKWKHQDYRNLDLKITWIYDLMDIVEKIKDQGMTDKRLKKQTNERKVQCIKTANSHKILRYVVYKVGGDKQVKKLPMINYENMKKAVSIVKEEIINDELLDELQNYFFQFCDVPRQNQKGKVIQRGLVFFGPPGTGKTQLTEALPDLIGFHLLSEGLSAADFMKSLVGQSSRMLKDLFRRALLSPHLICSLGIDQVDGLVPDRKDKQEKNKQEGVSMILSLIGGNSNVPNLMLFTSTNHLKKIDEAVRRRLSGQYQVGRPNPEARKKIIISSIPDLDYKHNLLKHMVNITTNFTGAALKTLGSNICLEMSRNQRQKKQKELTIEWITQSTIKVAEKFKIKFGQKTFPQICSGKFNKKYIFTEKFVKSIANRFLLINSKNQMQFVLSYAQILSKYEQQKNGSFILTPYFQVCQDSLRIEDISFSSAFDNFYEWVTKSLVKFKGKGEIKKAVTQQELNAIMTKNKGKFQIPTILLIKDIGGTRTGAILKDQRYQFFQRPIQNLYVLYYVSQQRYKEMYQILNWKLAIQKPYTGRITIQLNEEPRMAFELNAPKGDETRYSFRNLLKTQKQNSTADDVIPELIEFFNERQVNFILLVDLQLTIQNSAFQESKILGVIEQKMDEARCYDKAAVIIDFDSLITMSQNVSDSSMGRSTSYSISSMNLYRQLIDFIKTFPKIRKVKEIQPDQQISKIKSTINLKNGHDNQKKQRDQQKWIAIIVKNKQLMKIIKQDLNFPPTPQECEQKQNQKNLKREKMCARCNTWYKQQDNRKERKCAQHSGPLIDMNKHKLCPDMTLRQAQLQTQTYKMQRKLLQKFAKKSKSSSQKSSISDQPFLYACCFKGLNQKGEDMYYHVTEQQLQQFDELQQKRNHDQWKYILRSLEKVWKEEKKLQEEKRRQEERQNDR